MEKHILSDPLCEKIMGQITTGDIIDFRNRLTKKHLAGSTVNKIVGILKTIFNEAEFREEILRNPVGKVGTVREKSETETGIFLKEEMRRLFPAEGYGVWKSLLEYTCFFLAANTGMRRGEILALKWMNTDLNDGVISVLVAWQKGRKELGPPKWGSVREIPITEALLPKLKEYKESTHNNGDDDFLFCNADGSPLGNTWWLKHFDAALARLNVDKRSRNLKPHSFRHTLNTFLLSEGTDPVLVRAITGWRNVSVQEGYTHLKAEHLTGTIARIDRIWAERESESQQQ